MERRGIACSGMGGEGGAGKVLNCRGMLLTYYFYMGFYFLSIISCFVIGCVLVRRSWPLEYGLLIVLVGLTIGWETCVSILIHYNINHKWVYNIVIPFETACILYILYRGAMQPLIKRAILILLGVLPVGLAVIYWVYGHFWVYNGVAGLMYIFLELVAAGLFVIDSFLHTKDALPMRRPFFWVAAGMIGYSSIYAVVLTIGIFFEKLVLPFFWVYSLSANTCMYGGFIASFVLLHRERRRVGLENTLRKS